MKNVWIRKDDHSHHAALILINCPSVILAFLKRKKYTLNINIC